MHASTYCRYLYPCSVLFGLLILLLPQSSSSNEEQCQGENRERIVVLKLGGSSITDKGTLETLDQNMLDWVASVISNTTTPLYQKLSPGTVETACHEEGNSSCCQISNKLLRSKFVVVHGAGSFGHQIAKSYGLKGYTEEPPPDESAHDPAINLMEGLAQTRLSVTKLNWQVVQTLLSHSIPAVGISPFAVGLQAHGDPLLKKRGEFKTSADPMSTLMHVICNALQVGLTPVLHGDAVLYGQQRVGILSGDTLVSQISTRSELTDSLSCSTSPRDEATMTTKQVDVVFLTDVDGVYTSDPKRDNHAILLPIIEVDSSGKIVSTGGKGLDIPICQNDGSSLSRSCGSTHEHDVTGGLETKLKAAIDIAKTGRVRVYIIKCGSEDASRVINGESLLERGTLIRLISDPH